MKEWLLVLCKIITIVTNRICEQNISRINSDRPSLQIPQFAFHISRNIPFRTEICTFLFWNVLCGIWERYHYYDVIMSTMAYQITRLASVYLTIYSGADQRKHQSSAALAFVRGIHRWPVNSPHKGPVTRKMFHLMTSSWHCGIYEFGVFQAVDMWQSSFISLAICSWQDIGYISELHQFKFVHRFGRLKHPSCMMIVTNL